MDSLRISDADRESAVEQLSEQFVLGRLTREELDERSDAVWSARTRGDLAPLFVDLPVGRQPDVLRDQRPAGRPARSGARGGHRVLLTVLLVLGTVVVLKHLPLLLLVLLAWFVLSRRYAVARPPWARHGHGGHRRHGW